jgi:uncharacterized protein
MMPGTATVHIALLTFDLQIPHADSLKSKRRVIKSLKDRMRTKFNASVAEIDYLDEWRRALIGVTMLSNDRRHLERSLSLLNQIVEEAGDVRLLDTKIEWL